MLSTVLGGALGVTVERPVRNVQLIPTTCFSSGFKPVKLQIFMCLISVFVEYTLHLSSPHIYGRSVFFSKLYDSE